VLSEYVPTAGGCCRVACRPSAVCCFLRCMMAAVECHATEQGCMLAIPQYWPTLLQAGLACCSSPVASRQACSVHVVIVFLVF
jgi:hypothetical protein